MEVALCKALQRIVLLIEREAKILCPVDTGRLRSSITTWVDAKGLHGRVTAGGTAFDGTNVYYAIFVEQGTWKMEAQPYLIPALEKVKPLVMGIIKDEYRKAA
jgi:HK97 gp10 family phage protein